MRPSEAFDFTEMYHHGGGKELIPIYKALGAQICAKAKAGALANRQSPRGNFQSTRSRLTLMVGMSPNTPQSNPISKRLVDLNNQSTPIAVKAQFRNPDDTPKDREVAGFAQHHIRRRNPRQCFNAFRGPLGNVFVPKSTSGIWLLLGTGAGHEKTSERHWNR